MGLYRKKTAFWRKMIHTKFVEHRLDFPKIQKGGGNDLWVHMNIGSDLKKVEFFKFSTLEICKWKGGQKGGQRFRTLVPTKYTIIWSSDESFRGEIWIFLKNHYLLLLNKNPLLNKPPLFKNKFSDFRFRLNKTPPQLFWRIIYCVWTSCYHKISTP